MVQSIFSQNITITEQGASSLCHSLPPSATAHITGAAADYTFSCDGTAPPPTPSSSLVLPQHQPSTFTTQGSQLILCSGFCSSFMLFPLFFPVFPPLSWRRVPSLFFSLNVHPLRVFAKQLLPVSKQSVCAASYSVMSSASISDNPLVFIRQPSSVSLPMVIYMICVAAGHLLRNTVTSGVITHKSRVLCK